jgi:tetratricopeptide (TPR) repeat protein
VNLRVEGSGGSARVCGPRTDRSARSQMTTDSPALGPRSAASLSSSITVDRTAHSSADQFGRLADLRFYTANWTDAAALYGLALDMDSANVKAAEWLFQTAKCYEHLKRWDEAIRAYSQCLMSAPSSPSAAADGADRAEGDDRRDRPSALTTSRPGAGSYAAALSAVQLRPMALNNRANCYKAQRRLDRARADYDEAIRVDPAHAKAYYNRAIVLRTRLQAACPPPTDDLTFSAIHTASDSEPAPVSVLITAEMHSTTAAALSDAIRAASLYADPRDVESQAHRLHSDRCDRCPERGRTGGRWRCRGQRR